MHTIKTIAQRRAVSICRLLTGVWILGLLSIASTSKAEFGASVVFNWQETPQYQRVPIERAVFDRGGYQLYDSDGEAIIVPFTNDNLYVMKFAVSSDGSTYFVNDGSTPVMYMPDNGYMAYGGDPTGRWYPFTHSWHPSTAVYIGLAPSWNDYVSMGWYPNMSYYGGYYSNQASLSIGMGSPELGLSFQIGGAQYNGWGSYSNYYGAHRAPYAVTVVNQNYYRWGGPSWRQYASNHPFVGTGRPYVSGRGYVANTAKASLAARNAAAATAHRTALAHERFVGNTAANKTASTTPARVFHGANATRTAKSTAQRTHAATASLKSRSATIRPAVRTARANQSQSARRAPRAASAQPAMRQSSFRQQSAPRGRPAAAMRQSGGGNRASQGSRQAPAASRKNNH